MHLAAIPAPGLAPNHEIFRVNTLSTYNVFEAARRLGVDNVVWASSETVLGLPFDVPPPYIPVDEEYAAAARERLLAVARRSASAWRTQILPLGSGPEGSRACASPT